MDRMEFKDRVLELKRIPAGEITGAPWNWRSHPEEQKTAVVDSIEELGFFDPLDVRLLKDGSVELIDGHLRQDLITVKIGPKTLVPCVVTDLNEAEAKKANLLKDPLAGMAGADDEKLDFLLRDVQTGSEALNELMDGLAEQIETENGDDETGSIVPLAIKRPPVMSWVLVGIQTIRFAEISEAIESISMIDGIILETVVNDDKPISG